MSLYPQIGQGSLNTASGIASRIKDLERKVGSLKSSAGYLGDGAVKEGKIAAEAVTGSKIKGGAVTTSHIQSGSITSDLITAGAINTGHIQAGAVTATQIAAGTITAGNIAAGTITATQIAAGTITAVQIAANTITAAKIAAGTITTTEIAADTILAGNIAANAITATELAANSVTSNHIQASTITAGDIATGTITATEIAAGTITGALIAGGTITATNIATGTLTGSLLAAATITGDKLVVDTITSREVVGTTLSGIFADLGTVTAGTLRIGVAGGQKVAIGDSISTSAGTKSGIVATDTSNNITFWADPATGNLQIKGQLLTGSTGLGALAAGGGTIDGTSNIASATIAGDRLVANTITASKIAAATITANEIASATITGGKIAAGTITTALLAAGAVTADKITVGFSGGNRLRNSTALHGLSPANDPAIFGGGSFTLATWLGPFDVSSSGVIDSVSIPSGRGIYGVSIAGNPHVYTPNVRCFGWTKLSAGFTVHQSGPGRTVRLGIQFWDSSFNFISQDTTNMAGTQGAWVRYKRENVAVPSSAAYVRVYCQVLSTAAGETIHWTQAQIEEGELATSWTLAPGDVSPNTVTATQILPGSITTGSLSATAIDAMTITGATFRTGSGNPRVQMDSTGVFAVDTGGTEVFRLSATQGSLSQGKTATASNVVSNPGTANDCGPQVAVEVGSNVHLVHIFVEAEAIAGGQDPIDFYIYEATDLNIDSGRGDKVMRGGGNGSYAYVRTALGPITAYPTTSKHGTYVSFRPTPGTRTYRLKCASSQTDVSNATEGSVRNRMMHVYTT